MPATRPTGSGSADLRERSGYDWRTVRSFRSKEEAGHEEPWFTFLAGDNPDYPEKILAAAQAQARHRLARMRAYRGRRRRGGRHSPVAAVKSGRHRGPGPAHLGRPAGHLQRRPAAGQGPLLRCHPPPSWPPAWRGRPGIQHRSGGHRGGTGQPRRGRRTPGDRPGRGVRRARHRGRALHRVRGRLLARRPLRLRARRPGRYRAPGGCRGPRGSPCACPPPRACG